MKMNKQYVLVISMAVALFLTAACRSEPTPVPTAVPTLVPTAVPTIAAATSTPVPTATTAPTNTPPPVAVITVPTNTPAPTPLPAIDLEAAKSSQPPHIFVGTAKIDGVLAPRGTLVSALIGDQIAASGLVGGNGNFSTIIVEIPGYPVTFQVGNFNASQPPITTEVGGATVLELNASRQ